MGWRLGSFRCVPALDHLWLEYLATPKLRHVLLIQGEFPGSFWLSLHFLARVPFDRAMLDEHKDFTRFQVKSH